jgi:hypothetical protein
MQSFDFLVVRVLFTMLYGEVHNEQMRSPMLIPNTTYDKQIPGTNLSYLPTAIISISRLRAKYRRVQLRWDSDVTGLGLG